LHTAALVNDQKIVSLLSLVNELDTSKQNKAKKMPFQLAIDYNNFDIIPQIVPQQYLRDNPTFISKIMSF